MKKYIFISLITACLFSSSVFSAPIETGISKEQYLKGNQVVDRETGLPIAGAEIIVPQKKYRIRTDENGYFILGANMTSPTIVFVHKDGYRDFSTTLLPYENNGAIKLQLTKGNINDITIESDLCHLGDNSFSPNSANSEDFKIKASGPFYSKTFQMAIGASLKTNYIVIGSIIGIDTLMAKKLGQNKVANSYATPPEVYFNGAKIAEIQVNGDNQRIKIPSNLIRNGSMNELTIKTGKNMLQPEHLDYDDIEFMNLSIQSE